MIIKQRFSKCYLNFDISGVFLFIQLLERITGVMVNVLASSVVDHGFNPR